MGRKIPAKKHRGVKDPLVQQARRLQSLKSKINAPPKDPDEQPVPRSLTRLFEFQNKHNDNKTQKTKKALKRLEHTKGHNNGDKKASVNPVSRLRKLPGETGRDFSLRINSAMKALHNATEQLDYPQDLMEEDEKGARMAAQRERRARKRQRAHKLTGEAADTPPTRAQRLAAKKLHNKQKALQAQQEKHEVVYERVPFGEVCSAPPALRPHKAQAHAQAQAGAPRPARRGLLLSAMLAEPRERARLEAVAAYRALRTLRAARHTSRPLATSNL